MPNFVGVFLLHSWKTFYAAYESNRRKTDSVPTDKCLEKYLDGIIRVTHRFRVSLLRCPEKQDPRMNLKQLRKIIFTFLI